MRLLERKLRSWTDNINLKINDKKKRNDLNEFRENDLVFLRNKPSSKSKWSQGLVVYFMEQRKYIDVGRNIISTHLSN